MSTIQSRDAEHPHVLRMGLMVGRQYKQLLGSVGLTSTCCNRGKLSVSKTFSVFEIFHTKY